MPQADEFGGILAAPTAPSQTDEFGGTLVTDQNRPTHDEFGGIVVGSQISPRFRVGINGKPFQTPESISQSPPVETIPKQLGQGWQDINTPLVNPNTDIPKTMLPASKSGQAAVGATQGLAEFGKSFTSPFSLATLGTGAALAKSFPWISRALSGAFGGLMTKQAAETAGQLAGLPSNQRDPQTVAKSLVDIAAAGGMAALSGYDAALAKHPAAVLPKAAAEAELPMPGTHKTPSGEITLDYTPKEGEAKIPDQPQPTLEQAQKDSQSQPQAAPPAQETQTRLKQPALDLVLEPQHQKAVQEAADEGGHQIEYRDPSDPNEPFARRIAQPDRATGKIVINPKELSAWLTENVPQGQEGAAIRSLLSEEQIHLATTDADAQGYHDSLTGIERSLGQRIYSKSGAPLSPVQLGHEMLRMRLQQLARMDVRETLERSVKERWTVRSLLAANDAIRSIREALGTKASKEGLAIISRVQGNLDAAIRASGAVQTSNEAAVSKELSDLGIKGVTYADRYSRQDKTRNPTKNYVIFDPKHIRITERNGRAVSLDEAQRRQKSDASEPGAQRKDKDAEDFKALQAKMTGLDFDSPTFEKDFEELGRQMEDIKNRNKGFVPGTEPQEPGATRKSRDQGQEEFFLPPLERGQQVERTQAEETGALPKAETHPEQDLQPEHLEWSKANAWQRLGKELANAPYTLGKLLTKDSRAKDTDLVSMTRRVVAMERPDGKGVDVVSVYRDGAAKFGARAVDPALAGKARPNVPLSDLLAEGYKPVASMLLKEPVTNFHRRFDSLEAFEDGVGRHMDAELSKGEVNPGGAETQGDVTKAVPITQPSVYSGVSDEDLSAVHDHFRKYGSAEEAVHAIADSPSKAALRNIIRKELNAVLDENPALSREEAVKQAIERIYDQTRSQDRKGYIEQAVRRLDKDLSGGHGQGHAGLEQEMGSEAEGAAGGESPGAIRKSLEDEWEGFKAYAARSIKAADIKKRIPVLFDAAQNNATADAGNAKQAIVLASTKQLDPAVKGVFAKRTLFKKNVAAAKTAREAGIAYIASGVKDQLGLWTADINKLAGFEKKLDNAEAKARTWSYSNNPFKVLESKRWGKAIKEYRAGLDYAKSNWNNREFVDGALTYQKEISEHRAWLDKSGITVQERENYIPGLMEGSFWGDDFITFGSRRLIGTEFRSPKKFANPYDAIEHGPFYLASRDLADLAGHHILQGHQMTEQRMAIYAMQGLKDPTSGDQVVKEPVWTTKDVVNPLTGETHPETRARAPSLGYELVKLTNGSAIAVKTGYLPVVKDMLLPGFITDFRIGDWEVGKDAILINGMLKHGVMTLWDSFHPSRVGQYALAQVGLKAKASGGAAALKYRPADLDAAVKTGYISQKAADWARGNVTIKTPRGDVNFTRQEIVRKFIDRGLNAAKNSDALYKSAVESLPYVGKLYKQTLAPYNNWLFDEYIPGLMAETAVTKFEQMHKDNPTVHWDRLMRDVARDENFYYGNSGRQGIFRNRHFQDIANLLLFAPKWQEGLFQKEIRTAYRATQLPRLMGGRKGLPVMGAMGDAMVRGLTAYFIGTQIVNLITRRQFTWQNPEKGHKMDAAIPLHDGSTIFISPMSVFAEATHDFIRLNETKSKAWDAIKQMGENRASPIGKLALIAGTGTSPEGNKYSSTAGVLGGMAGQITPGVGPSPFTFSTPARELGNAIAPNVIAPNPPGKFARGVFSSAGGIKAEIGQTPQQQIYTKANDFAKANGYKPETGWEEVPTDQPGYSKLRAAIRLNDTSEAKKQFDAMVATHGGGKQGENAVFKAMKLAAHRPFTGSAKAERAFLHSLSDKELADYQKAEEQRLTELDKFWDFVAKLPEK